MIDYEELELSTDLAAQAVYDEWFAEQAAAPLIEYWNGVAEAQGFESGWDAGYDDGIDDAPKPAPKRPPLLQEVLAEARLPGPYDKD